MIFFFKMVDLNYNLTADSSYLIKNVENLLISKITMRIEWIQLRKKKCLKQGIKTGALLTLLTREQS